MKIISFAWTTEALLAGRKSCTRREWSANYALRYLENDLVAAYNRNPRNGGHQIAVIRLTAGPELSNTAVLPDGDYEAEGLAYMEERGLRIQGLTPRQFWEAWKAAQESVYIIRFKVVDALG